MGRITKNYMLPIGSAVFAVGLVVTLLAWVNAYNATPALDWYDRFLESVPGSDQGDWNVFLMILGPVLLITGAWYAGEQLVLRRRFERLIATTKKSEFVGNRKDLDNLAKRLPRTYRRRIEEKEQGFRSMR